MFRQLFLMLVIAAVLATAGCASDRGGARWDSPSYNSQGSGGGSCPSCR